MDANFRPIRCGSRNATPYLRKNFLKFCGHMAPYYCHIADIGCGNMRNSDYLREFGYYNIHAFDKVTDRGTEIDLRTESIPLRNESVSVILCNYVLCFLTQAERQKVILEMDRIACDGCIAFVELHPAKSAYPYDIYEIINIFKWSVGGWECIHLVNDRFTLRKTGR